MARDRIRRILPSSRLHRPIPPTTLRPPPNPECRCRSPPFLPSHHRRCATTMRRGWPSSPRTFASASATAAATNANAIPSHRKDDAVVAISSSSSSPREGSRLPPWRGGGEGLRRHHRRDDDDDDDGIDIDGERDDGTEYCSDAVVTWTAECMRSAVRCYASDVSSRGANRSSSLAYSSRRRRRPRRVVGKRRKKWRWIWRGTSRGVRAVASTTTLIVVAE